MSRHVDDRKGVKWIDSQLSIFINLCLTEVNKGNRPTTTLNREGWGNVHAAFNRQANVSYSVAQLRNKWDSMKTEYQLFKKLMYRESGLGWNEAARSVLASDTWWKERIEENRAYKKFRNRDLSIYFTHYETLFGSVVATGSRARAANTYSTVDLEEGEEFTEVDVDDGKEGSGDSDDNDNQSPPANLMFSTSSLKSGRSSGSKRKRGAELMKEGHDGLVAAMSCRSTSTTAANEDKSLVEAHNVLKGMPQVEYGSDVYFYAQRYLFNKQNRTVFLNEINDDLRYAQILYNFKYNNHPAAGASGQFGGQFGGQSSNHFGGSG